MIEFVEDLKKIQNSTNNAAKLDDSNDSSADSSSDFSNKGVEYLISKLDLFQEMETIFDQKTDPNIILNHPTIVLNFTKKFISKNQIIKSKELMDQINQILQETDFIKLKAKTLNFWKYSLQEQSKTNNGFEKFAKYLNNKRSQSFPDKLNKSMLYIFYIFKIAENFNFCFDEIDFNKFIDVPIDQEFCNNVLNLLETNKVIEFANQKIIAKYLKEIIQKFILKQKIEENLLYDIRIFQDNKILQDHDEEKFKEIEYLKNLISKNSLDFKSIDLIVNKYHEEIVNLLLEIFEKINQDAKFIMEYLKAIQNEVDKERKKAMLSNLTETFMNCPTAKMNLIQLRTHALNCHLKNITHKANEMKNKKNANQRILSVLTWAEILIKKIQTTNNIIRKLPIEKIKIETTCAEIIYFLTTQDELKSIWDQIKQEYLQSIIIKYILKKNPKALIYPDLKITEENENLKDIAKLQNWLNNNQASCPDLLDKNQSIIIELLEKAIHESDICEQEKKDHQEALNQIKNNQNRQQKINELNHFWNKLINGALPQNENATPANSTVVNSSKIHSIPENSNQAKNITSQSLLLYNILKQEVSSAKMDSRKINLQTIVDKIRNSTESQKTKDEALSPILLIEKIHKKQEKAILDLFTQLENIYENETSSNLNSKQRNTQKYLENKLGQLKETFAKIDKAILNFVQKKLEDLFKNQKQDKAASVFSKNWQMIKKIEEIVKQYNLMNEKNDSMKNLQYNITILEKILKELEEIIFNFEPENSAETDFEQFKKYKLNNRKIQDHPNSISAFLNFVKEFEDFKSSNLHSNNCKNQEDTTNKVCKVQNNFDTKSHIQNSQKTTSRRKPNAINFSTSNTNPNDNDDSKTITAIISDDDSAAILPLNEIQFDETTKKQNDKTLSFPDKTLQFYENSNEQTTNLSISANDAVNPVTFETKKIAYDNNYENLILYTNRTQTVKHTNSEPETLAELVQSSIQEQAENTNGEIFEINNSNLPNEEIQKIFNFWIEILNKFYYDNMTSCQDKNMQNYYNTCLQHIHFLANKLSIVQSNPTLQNIENYNDQLNIVQFINQQRNKNPKQTKLYDEKHYQELNLPPANHINEELAILPNFNRWISDLYNFYNELLIQGFNENTKMHATILEKINNLRSLRYKLINRLSEENIQNYNDQLKLIKMFDQARYFS